MIRLRLYMMGHEGRSLPIVLIVFALSFAVGIFITNSWIKKQVEMEPSVQPAAETSQSIPQQAASSQIKKQPSTLVSGTATLKETQSTQTQSHTATKTPERQVTYEQPLQEVILDQ